MSHLVHLCVVGDDHSTTDLCHQVDDWTVLLKPRCDWQDPVITESHRTQLLHIPMELQFTSEPHNTPFLSHKGSMRIEPAALLH